MPLPDLGTGPAPVPGRPDDVAPGVLRLTAPNPGLMTGPGTNSYLIGHGPVAVLDPGPDDAGHQEGIVRLAQERGLRIRWIVVTHTHPDHAPGAARLATLTGAEVVGFGPDPGSGPPFSPDRSVGDGWRLGEDAGIPLRAVHTPGHASNHLCWLHEEQGMLFTGDHVMHGSTVVIRPPDGDMAAYLRSLGAVMSLEPLPRTLAPGHGKVIGHPARAVEALIAHRRAREEIVRAALAGAGRATVDELLPVVYADVTEAQLPVARFSLWAHLRKLAGEGGATVEPAPRRRRTADGSAAPEEDPELGATWVAAAGG